MRGFPEILHISGGNVVSEIVSDEIGVNDWIDP